MNVQLTDPELVSCVSQWPSSTASYFEELFYTDCTKVEVKTKSALSWSRHWLQRNCDCEPRSCPLKVSKYFPWGVGAFSDVSRDHIHLNSRDNPLYLSKLRFSPTEQTQLLLVTNPSSDFKNIPMRDIKQATSMFSTLTFYRIPSWDSPRVAKGILSESVLWVVWAFPTVCFTQEYKQSLHITFITVIFSCNESKTSDFLSDASL